MSDVPRENVITVKLRDAEAEDLGIYISIHGQMRVIDMLAVSYVLLNACVEAGEDHLGGAATAVHGAAQAVLRTLKQEYPGTTVSEVKN